MDVGLEDVLETLINSQNYKKMKTLNLEKIKLGANDMLQREQLKTVFGGYSNIYPGDCNDDCKNDSDCGDSRACISLKVSKCQSPVRRCVYPAE